MRSWKLASLVAVILASSSSVGSAAFTVYTDLSGFSASTNSSLVEDFEAVAPKDTALVSFTSNGITYTGVQASNPNVWVASPGYTNFGLPGATTTSILTSTGNEIFEIDLSSVPRTVVGFDVYLNDFGPVTTEYFGSAANLIHTVIDLRGAGDVLFLGVSSDEPIYKIRWTAVGGETINTGLDNLRLGTTLVPTPGAVLLGALGASLVGWFRRRRML
jgi:hypothetical protein